MTRIGVLADPYPYLPRSDTNLATACAKVQREWRIRLFEADGSH